MKSLFKNKRGNWLDLFEFIGGSIYLGIVIVIVLVLLTSFYNSINTTAQTDPTLNNSVALGYAEDVKDKFPLASDFILPMVYVFVLGFSVWSARQVQSSHKFFFILVFIMIMLVLAAMAIETAWQEFATNPAIITYISEIPITNFMISNLRMVILITGLIVGGSLYAKAE